MTTDLPSEQAAEQAASHVRQALDLIERQTPALRPLLRAFRGLMAQRVAIKAELPALDQPLPEVDPARLARGVPLARVDDFLACQGLDLAAYMESSARRLLPALEEGFPALRQDVKALRRAMAEKRLDVAAALEAVLSGDAAELERRAGEAGLPSAALEFVLRELSKPFLEKRAEALAARLEGLTWEQGSCPLCGSLPELAFLRGEGGQRWLRCSLCAHHWRFKRTACPVCGNEEQDQLEFFFAEGRERERVESCRRCGKYVVSLDVRGMDEPPAWEVAALGLVHLDLLAQERGLTPAAWCAWNQVK